MINRNITKNILEALTDTPVVFLRGARQTGKSTLARELKKTIADSLYFTLDTATVFASAGGDPEGFIAGVAENPGLVIIDEVQKAPGLFPAIKQQVDNNRRPGMFMLTGSSNIVASLKASDSLAGRMEIFTLWPFSQGEIAGVEDSFVDDIFEPGKKKIAFTPETRDGILDRILRGGYPEAAARSLEKRRRAWFDSYITAILERDVRDIANIQDVAAMARLLKILASRPASLLNRSELARTAGVPLTTLNRFLSLLESVFMVYELPAWASNRGKRFVKSAKIMFTDTGLLSNMAGLGLKRLIDNPQIAGPALENFAASELGKQLSWSRTQAALYHFRSTANKEVDLVLEDNSGRVVGIEIKLSSSVSAGDFSGIRALKEIAGENFVRGVVLNSGTEIVPFGRELYAMPLSALWGK